MEMAQGRGVEEPSIDIRQEEQPALLDEVERARVFWPHHQNPFPEGVKDEPVAIQEAFDTLEAAVTDGRLTGPQLPNIRQIFRWNRDSETGYPDELDPSRNDYIAPV
ncbi:MAG: hypothetical protein KDD70_12425, partial [Bdellovibrionales bacterium]|nr:hypothetical protein [Bdellovibrionales bacterium]